MNYKLGDVVELNNGRILTVNLIDSDEPDSTDNRGLFEYINADGQLESLHSPRMYNEDWIVKVHGNIHEGLEILDRWNDE